MPFPAAAIEGIPNKRRKQEKTKRLALESLQLISRDMPSWVLTMTPNEMKDYAATQTDVVADLAWLLGTIRDVLMLKQEED